MAVPIFIVLLFAAAVAGVYAWVSVDDQAKAEHSKETDAKLECAQKIQELKAAIENFKAETERKVETAVSKSATAEAISIDIRDSIKGQVEQAVGTAKAASDMAHAAMLQTAKPQKMIVEGKVQLERAPSEKKDDKPRRSP